MIRLGDKDIFTVESGGTPNTEVADYWGGDINWVTLVDLPQKNLITKIINTGRKLTKEGLGNSSAKLLPIDSILVSSRATIGRVAIAKQPLATNQGFKNIVIKDKAKVLPIYLALYMTSRKEEMERMASGGTFKEITKTNFQEIEVPVPSIAIQQEIISALDEQDKIIESNKKLIVLMERKIEEVLSTI